MLVIDTVAYYYCAECGVGKIESDKFAKSLRHFKIKERGMICMLCKKKMHLSSAKFKMLKPEDVYPITGVT